MPNELEAAYSGAPWALSGLLFGIDGYHDTDARPLGERRAPSAAKEGVPMELKACPYRDERHQMPMNVSALEQLTRHLDAAIDDIEKFHALAGPSDPSWGRMFEAIVDQLLRPAVFLLRTRGADGPVPAVCAVGYKLAAGFFDVLRRLLRAEALGEAPAIDVESFYDFVRRERALIGSSEVCAGPANLIKRVSGALLIPKNEVAADDPEGRAAIAALVGRQIRVGIAWELFDRACERGFFITDNACERLVARNDFMRRALDGRAEEVQHAAPVSVDHARAAFTAIGDEAAPILPALDKWRDGATIPEVSSAELARLIEFGDGALRAEDPDFTACFCRDVANYLAVYRATVILQRDLEKRLRYYLGYAPQAEVKLNGLLLPKPKSLRWYEALLGHQLRCGGEEQPALAFRNPHREVVVTKTN